MVEWPIELRLRLVGSEMPSQQMSGCGTFETCRPVLKMSVSRVPEVAGAWSNDAIDPTVDWPQFAPVQ
jgi:hypothetical protein